MLAAKPLNHSDPRTFHHSTQLTDDLFGRLNRPINLLVLGIDNTPSPESNRTTASANQPNPLAGNSDTMLLVRLLPQTHQINVLSIPRDTLIDLPGVGIDKINDANFRGGAALATQSVSHLMGNVSIDRYIRLDTQGLIQLVDTLGGVSVDIPKAMDYTDNTQHLKIHFTPGPQHLTGQQLQEYVRFRHDELGDIGRVQRQQVVLRTLSDALLKPETLPKLPQLMRVLQNNIDTDLSVQEMLSITQLFAATHAKQISFVMLPGRFSRPDEYPLSYWVTAPEELAPIIAHYLQDAGTAPTSDRPPLAPQSLRIAVANASGQTGADVDLVDWLHNQGFSNAYLTDHEIDTVGAGATTQIVAQRGNPQAAHTIQKMLTLGNVQVDSTGDVMSDVTVVVGADLAARLSHQ